MAEAQANGGGGTELDTLPKVNEEITSSSNRIYRLKSVLGSGGYGVVYLSKAGTRAVAIKTEKYHRMLAYTEEIVLKAANARGANHFCELIDYGSEPPNFIYTVMTLLHHDLTKLRNEMPGRHFTHSTAARVAMQALDAIEELHSLGFVSRDIKPNNFAPGHRLNQQSKTIYMYDFGLCRRYLDRSGRVIPSRGEVGWRGTTRYGSLKAHQRLDLGRCDDLESWLYTIVEITNGNIPWRRKNDRDYVRKYKQRIRFGRDRVDFFAGCPPCFGNFLSEIDQLQFDSKPPYQTIRSQLQQFCDEKNYVWTAPWDWDSGEDEDDLNSEAETQDSSQPGATTSA